MAPRTRASAADAEPPDIAALESRASRDAGGVPPELLDGYLAALAQVSMGRPFGQRELHRRREAGAHAAEQGVPMRGVLDLYLTATWVAWPSLPGVRSAAGTDSLRRIGEVVFRAADAAVMAVAEGYEEAQRWSARQEESSRREFVDDLLDGRNLESLAERAERYGLRLAGSNVVVAVRAAEPLADGGPVAQLIEPSVRLRADARDVLVTTKDGLLVSVAPDAPGVVDSLVDHVVEALASDKSARVGVGRPQRGPGGTVRSFEQAKNALDIGRRLHLPGPVYWARDLLVYQVLARDSAALADLVEDILEPLRAARTGPTTLLDTLFTYFAVGRVATAAATELHVSVRTVTYRLDRIGTLTGYSVYDPQQSFTLHVAVLGARLLGWPNASGSTSN